MLRFPGIFLNLIMIIKMTQNETMRQVLESRCKREIKLQVKIVDLEKSFNVLFFNDL